MTSPATPASASGTSATAALVDVALEAVQVDAAGRVLGAVGATMPAGDAPAHGQRVLVGMFDACGECDICRRGGAPVCPRGARRALTAGELAAGGAARVVRCAARWLVALGDGLELPGPQAAAAAGDVALAYTLYARTGVAAREPVVITGEGPVARFLVEILRAKGIAPVVVGGASPAWRAWLEARGAGIAAPEGGRAAVADALATVASDPTAAGRPWRVIATADVAVAAALAGPRATLTVLADAGALAAAGPALGAALAREVTMIGVAAPHPDLVLEAAALVARGELDLAGGVLVRSPDEPAPTDAHRADVVVLPRA